jgi:hypothetical protein
MTGGMSAIGPGPTFRFALHLSAFGGKADMTVRRSPLSLLGVKRTCRFALHMSAFDPKRTFGRLASISSSGHVEPVRYRV